MAKCPVRPPRITFKCTRCRYEKRQRRGIYKNESECGCPHWMMPNFIKVEVDANGQETKID